MTSDATDALKRLTSTFTVKHNDGEVSVGLRDGCRCCQDGFSCSPRFQYYSDNEGWGPYRLLWAGHKL